MNPDETTKRDGGLEGDPARDPLWCDPEGREPDGRDTEVSALQALLGPFRATATDVDLGPLLARAMVDGEARRRRGLVLLRSALAALVLLGLYFGLGGRSEPGSNPPEASPRGVTLADGSVLSAPGHYEVADLSIDLDGEAEVELLSLQTRPRRVRSSGGTVEFSTASPLAIETRGGLVECPSGRLRIVTDPGGDLSIEASTARCTVELNEVRHLLVPSARVTSFAADADSPARLGTPFLPGISTYVRDLCDKFDHGPTTTWSDPRPYERVAEAAGSEADTYVLWSLLAKAEARDLPAARDSLESRLIEIANFPPAAKLLKIRTFTTAQWLEHLEPLW